jgi:hypothetical protein
MEIDFKNVKWVEADQNPYGMRILDCRSVTGHLISSSQDRNVVDRFLLQRSFDPELLKGEMPADAQVISANLVYPDPDITEYGLYYSADVMEDKWDIFHAGEHLYFLRSWTGNLIFRAHISSMDATLSVDSVEVSGDMRSGNERYSICQVDFLIKSHLYRREVPHPLPGELPDDPSALVLFSFSQYGRWAFYGSFEDTSTVRIL